MFKNKTLYRLLFILSFLLGGPAYAKDFSPVDTDTSVFHLPAKALEDLPSFFTVDNGLIVLTGGSLTALDWTCLDHENALAYQLKNLNIQPLFDFGNIYGQPILWIVGSLGTWETGALVSDPKIQQFGRDLTEALVMEGVAGYAIKFSVGRTGPNGEADSFPSGHSSTVFAAAPVIMKYWGVEAGIPAYALAVLTGFSRVEGQWHYLSDVLAGATLGTVIGNSVVSRSSGLSVTAIPGGLDLCLKFD